MNGYIVGNDDENTNFTMVLHTSQRNSMMYKYNDSCGEAKFRHLKPNIQTWHRYRSIVNLDIDDVAKNSNQRNMQWRLKYEFTWPSKYKYHKLLQQTLHSLMF